MKRLSKSILLLALIVAQITKPYVFWAREKRQLTERRHTEYQIHSEGQSIILLQKSNRRISQYQRQDIYRDTTELMESNIMKLEEAIQPSSERHDTELGLLFSRLSGTILFGEKQK